MHSLARLLTLLLILAVPLRAQTALANAQRAQAMLGPAVWSQIIRVDNEARASRYPQTVHALVFELAEILWFYTDADGTQSFSLHRGQLAEEKADFGPLLRGIDPGFRRWTPITRPPQEPGDGKAPLRNGCFIESFALLRERLSRGASIREPRLLSYYADTASGSKGHTVLAFEIAGSIEVFDPIRPGRRSVFPQALGADPLALARAIEGRSVTKARVIPLELPAIAPAIMADVRGSRTDARAAAQGES
ncbi:MAG: hypothetical protein EXS37_07815 [Opitutus sp.]|nr:hypothetical protein [Opitutus sp.]